MKIALDWDDTVTRNARFWKQFVRLCKLYNVDVRIVTMRRPREICEEMQEFSASTGVTIVCTSRKQKRVHLRGDPWQPDIWIDDSPEFIVDWEAKMIGEK